MISALTNIGSLRALNAIGNSQRDLTTSLERLATGKRINRAADDPAGLVAVTDFKSRIAEINATLGALDQEEFSLGAREGASSAQQDLVLELKGLIITGANRSALSPEELDALQIQIDGLVGAIDFVSNTSTYKGQQILQGINSTTIGAGTATAADGTAYTLTDLKTGGRLNLRTGDLEAADKLLGGATSYMSTQRATIGARLQGIDSQRRSLGTELANIDSARSLIEDTDYAEETAKLVRSQTLQQAAIYVRQAAQQQQADAVLSLLKGVIDGQR